MSELTTADPIATPEDGDIFPVRKASLPGLLKITLLQTAAYVRNALFGSLAGQAGMVPVVNGAEDGFDWTEPGTGGGGGGGGLTGLPSYSDTNATGTVEFKNNPSAAAIVSAVSVEVPASNVDRTFAVSMNFNTNSSGGSNPALSLVLDNTSIVSQARLTSTIDGNFGFGFNGNHVGIVTVPGDGVAHTIGAGVSQFGGGSGFTVNVTRADICAQQVDDNPVVASGGNQINGCYLYKSTPQAVNVANSQIIQTFDTELYDFEGFHDTVTNNSRITVPAGVDYINVWARWARTIDTSAYNIFWIQEFDAGGTLVNEWRFDLRTFESTIFNNGETRFIPAVEGHYFQLKVQTGVSGGNSASGLGGTTFGCETKTA